ncbi:hypothetical protein NJC38_06675 [Pseudomonas sp. 21LCFQ010]|uniref:hypothetical protein n=1 Tax=Pseudomonas sp. 21LCFQ010 TaxID=2957506 RepID=UPI002097A55F|nr:hypothetical protein [Pseudomonas sp. 21LCFQ010]MCO8161839.1 hypothetical protein [Pseudomonas sp. 21LCFQ010]
MNINTSSIAAAYAPSTRTSSGNNGQQAQASYAAQAATVQAATVASSPAEKPLPVQAYALPAWMTVTSASVIKADNTGAITISVQNQALMNADPQEQAQLDELWRQHASQVYADNGLSDLGTRYEATRNNPELDTKLHRQFNQSVTADPQLMALLDKFGIALLPVA